MDPESKKFGGDIYMVGHVTKHCSLIGKEYWYGTLIKRGPRELTGSVDLLNHFKLLPHFEFFCKRPLPVSISDAHYLYNLVGNIEIRKGDGMQLDQLIQDTSLSSGSNYRIQPLDLDILKEAFQLKETVPIDFPAAEKGILTVAGKSKGESKYEEKKHKKHKDRDKDKDKEHRKHKHRQKDRSKDKEMVKKKDKNRHHDSSADPSKKHHEKKRKHDGDDDLNIVHKHKKVR